MAHPTRGSPNLTAVLAVIPVRDGVLPAGAAETAAECGHRSMVIGSGTLEVVGLLGGTVTL